MKPCPPPDRRRPLAATLLAAVVVAGCASFAQPGAVPPPEGPGRYTWLTLPITALGDTQEHEATGYPLHDNDSAIDAFVEVTQRPPEQPLFGRRIVEHALHAHPDEPWLHLGDVLDLSCRSEAQRMTKVFVASGRPGAILPGNHDGLMFGIYNYNLFDALRDVGAEKWHRACRRGAATGDTTRKSDEEAFGKRDFIATYLSLQARAGLAPAGLDASKAKEDSRISWRHPDPKAFVSAVEARLIDGADYAGSFVAQRLKLPRAPGADRDVIIVGLDTNQAGPVVGLWDTALGRSPGSTGHMRLEQVRAVTPWVLEAARNGDIVVFAGHHNWESIGLPSRLMLRELMSNVVHPLVYLSAHTHRGFWAEHRVLDNRPLLELNVSSLSDWPIAYRRISFAYDEQAARLLVRGDLMPRGERPADSDSELLAAWSARTCERAGVDLGRMQTADLALVRRQRQERGSLVDWVREELSIACESCEASRLGRAQAYQDEMLTALRELDADLGPAAHRLDGVKLPEWCGARSVRECIAAVMSETADDLASKRALFRRKSQLVGVLTEHLDELDAPHARAYMTCRAIQAAKADFDASDDDSRSEATRRAGHFFRVEASVGLW